MLSNSVDPICICLGPCVQPCRSENAAAKRDRFCKMFIASWKIIHDLPEDLPEHLPDHADFMGFIAPRCKELHPGDKYGAKQILGHSFHHTRYGKHYKNPSKRYRPPRDRFLTPYHQAKELLERAEMEQAEMETRLGCA